MQVQTQFAIDHKCHIIVKFINSLKYAKFPKLKIYNQSDL